MTICVRIFILFVILVKVDSIFKKTVEKSQCPTVRSYKWFDLEQILGSWYVIQYYANSEELEIYRCMRTVFSLSPDDIQIYMNFTFSFLDDPDNDQLYGNITWKIPDLEKPSHWIHAENTYEGVYNTYILDINTADDTSWVLLLHCAEKSTTSIYLSNFILARQTYLATNVLSYLRDKLSRYNIELQYLFPMDQTDCTPQNLPLYYRQTNPNQNRGKHPMNQFNDTFIDNTATYLNTENIISHKIPESS